MRDYEKVADEIWRGNTVTIAGLKKLAMDEIRQVRIAVRNKYRGGPQANRFTGRNSARACESTSAVMENTAWKLFYMGAQVTAEYSSLRALARNIQVERQDSTVKSVQEFISIWDQRHSPSGY